MIDDTIRAIVEEATAPLLDAIRTLREALDGRRADAGYTSVDDAAEHFAVSPKTIRELIADETIPSLRVGRLLRVRLADIEAALRASKGEVIDLEERAKAMLRRGAR